MTKFYLDRGVFILLLTLFLCTGVRAQTIQQQQSFEDIAPANELPFTTNFPQYADGPGDDVFGVVSSISNIPTAQDGTSFFGAIDVQSPGTNEGDGILTFDAGNICNLVNPQFAWFYNVKGLDTGDDLFYQLVLDGVEQDRIQYVDGGGNFSTNDWTEITINVPNTATFVELRLIIDQNGSDQVGIDNVRVLATGTNGTCTAICGVNADDDDVSLNCVARTETDNADQVTASIEYSGQEVGVTVTVSGGATIAANSDDPAAVAGGTIEVENLIEGGSYTLTISGGDCTMGNEVVIQIDVPADFCTPSNIVINEVLADPSSVNDANGDGDFDGADDEFVEIYNVGTDPVDVSGFTIEEGSGVFFEFPAGTVIPSGGFFTVFGGGTINKPECQDAAIANERNFLGLNNTGDIVIVRDPTGRIIASMTYGSEGNNDESLALNPDGNLAGGYVPHSTIGTNPLSNSSCASNDMPIILPIELTQFNANAGAKQVKLTWATDNERDNNYFLVDRSNDGRTWAELGMVNAGNTAANAYEFMDDAPRAGANYYRLRQYDLDGTMTEYGPVAANFAGGPFTVYPNPVRSELNFSQSLAEGDVATLTDINGKFLRQLPAGSNRTDVSDLAAGIYLLRLQRAGATDVIRFVKD